MTSTNRSQALKSGRSQVRFLGLHYDLLEEDEVVEALLKRPAEEDFAFVVTPNADHIVRIERSEPRVLQAYLDANLCLNDSRIVGIVARMLGRPITTVPGADLVRKFFHSPGFEPEHPILLVGGTPDLFERLVAGFSLKNAKHYDAPMGLLHDKSKFEETVRFAENNSTGLTLFAVGSPQQELIAHEIWKRGKAKGVGLCIGAAVEFLVYPDRRAPAWISRLGLEWLFRLVKEPRRLWRRYLVDSPRLFKLVFQDWRANRGTHHE